MTHQPFLNFHANLCITNHRQPNQLQFIWPQISILQISEHSAEWIMKIERIMQRWVSLNEQKSPVFLRSCITVVFFLFYLRTATTATQQRAEKRTQREYKNNSREEKAKILRIHTPARSPTQKRPRTCFSLNLVDFSLCTQSSGWRQRD